ncbi:MAG TPA: RDD family protein [Steroidobacteraceae bacterium]
MSTDALIVTSPTGVDVELAIAGPGSRAYAFLIDWHIRLLVALTWYVAAAYKLSGMPYLVAGSPASSFAIAGIPAIAIYFLYHPLVELAMRGGTPGKRMAGVRVVNRQGGSPSTLAVLVRNAFRLIDSAPALYGIGMCMTIFTVQRVRLGDLAAGTLLVHDGDTDAKALMQLGSLSLNPTLDAGTLALGNDLLLRWNDLQPERRRELARDLLHRIDTAVGSASDLGRLDALNDRNLQQRLRNSLSGRPA